MERKTALIQGIIAGTLFGTSSIFIRISGEISAFSISMWRLIIASATLILLGLILKRGFSINSVRQNFKHLFLLGALLGIHLILFVSAVKDTTILNATVLVNTTPIFSVVISSFLYRMKPTKIALIGIAISFAGVVLIAYSDAYATDSIGNLIGDAEATLAAVAASFYLNYGRDKRNKIPLLSTMLIIYLVATLTVAVSTVLIGEAIEVPINYVALQPLLGLGVLSTATAHTLYFSSLSRLKSFETATLALLEPIGATLLGVILFSEVPKFVFVLGATLMFIGIFSMTIQK